jgi:hypothetical protein
LAANSGIAFQALFAGEERPWITVWLEPVPREMEGRIDDNEPLIGQ